MQLHQVYGKDQKLSHEGFHMKVCTSDSDLVKEKSTSQAEWNHISEAPFMCVKQLHNQCEILWVTDTGIELMVLNMLRWQDARKDLDSLILLSWFLLIAQSRRPTNGELQ